MNRRRLLAAGASLPALVRFAGLGAGLLAPTTAFASDYRALVVLFLNGGNDGHNSLVPTDAAHAEYSRARPGLALSRTELDALGGNSAGHTWGVHPALAPLVPLYNQGRLAWILNAGPLIVPATAQQVKDRAVEVPLFLLSHSDQVAMQQGWMGDEDQSGWAGRALEALPEGLRHSLSAVTLDNHRTLVLGRRSPVSWMSAEAQQYWGHANLSDPAHFWTRTLQRAAQLQSTNAYEAEYSRTFDNSVRDAMDVVSAQKMAAPPTGNFGSDRLARMLRRLAEMLPVFKQLGYRRQVFLVNWGALDTHAIQRGSQDITQDYQLDLVGRAVAAFDDSNRASGVDMEVVTLMMTDFGRTLRPASGGGSDHAWGNHWFVLGGPVAGGAVYGTLPILRSGGPDDADRGGEGRFAPTISTDQVGATLMQWFGLPPSQFVEVFPNLINFTDKTVNFIRAT